MNQETKDLIDQGKMLPLMEEFYTIQGEGYHTGKAAYFILVGGCDVGCHWCDVKESWNADLHPPTLADTIVDNVFPGNRYNGPSQTFQVNVLHSSCHASVRLFRVGV